MKVLRNIKISGRDTAVALGYFDGVHIGHREVILKAVNVKLLPLVLTFDYSNSIPNSKVEFKYITPNRTRFLLMEKLSIKIVVCPYFEDIKNLTFLEFFEDILVKKLNAKFIVCGENFLFGRERKGNTKILKCLAKKRNIRVEVLNLLKIQGEVVSSSRIRKVIEKGDLNLLKKLLGRHYFFDFKIENIYYDRFRVIVIEHIKKNMAFLPCGRYNVIIKILDISFKGVAKVSLFKEEKILNLYFLFNIRQKLKDAFARVIFLNIA